MTTSPNDVHRKIEAAEFRTVSWLKAAYTGAPLSRVEAREALLHVGHLAMTGPLTADEWLAVTSRLVHCAIPKNEINLRFADLVFGLTDADDLKIEMALRALLAPVTR